MGLFYKIKHMSAMKQIVLGYCTIILIGGTLLSLPISSRHGEFTSFMDAVYTATSATCVTGLIRFDTYTYWSTFGQLVILALIQIGGIGFMTIALSFITLTKHKIGFQSRMMMQESVAAPQVGGIVRMSKFILEGTIVVEGIGCLLLCFYFCPLLGFGKGLYFSIFHTISAFCNAGIDLMGYFDPYSSLIGVQSNWYVNSIIMLLIIIGGLGFFVWHDVVEHHFHFHKYRLHSKIVLSTSILLIVIGAVGIALFEYQGAAFAGQDASTIALSSLFQSVTTRTAGFNSVDLEVMNPSSHMLMTCLMLIGGSPGSTAGGIKTTTFIVLLLSIISTFRNRKDIEIYGRRLEDGILRKASCIFLSYMMLVLVVAMIIAKLENFPIMDALFESVSAIATVGLSLGISVKVGLVSEILLCLLMLIGRVGSITILLAFSTGAKWKTQSKLPVEKIQVG